MITRVGAAAREEMEFDLPDALVALDPPEDRGLRRDDVRLLVSRLPGAKSITAVSGSYPIS